MNLEELKMKNRVVIELLKSLNICPGFKIKAEYSTNDNDKKVIVVQEQPGEKTVLWSGNIFNYYQIMIFGLSIQECKDISTLIGELIGEHFIQEMGETKWQIIFQQFSNPQTLEYIVDENMRRVGYTATLKCIVNLISEPR